MHKKGRDFDLWIEENLYGSEIIPEIEAYVDNGIAPMVPCYSSWHGTVSWLLVDLARVDKLRINLFLSGGHWNCEIFYNRVRSVGIHLEIQMAVCLAIANAVDNGLRIPERGQDE